MEPHIRLQRLAQIGIVLAFGAIIMCTVGLVLSWMGPDSAGRLPLMLVVPGGVMVLAAAYLLLGATRTAPEDWRRLYRNGSGLLLVGACIAAVTVPAAGILTHTDEPLLQAFLVGAVGLQGPLAMLLLSRLLGRSAKRGGD